MSNFYFTTTLPYVNATPHLGFAWEILTGDFICRYQRGMGKSVIFNTGTDEHGQKIYQKALSLSLTPRAYTNQAMKPFRQLISLLGLKVDNFIRTSDTKHLSAAQHMWQHCLAKGDIYKKKYTTKYCVGCELEKTDSELVDGRCPLHPQQELELRQEDNYFFRFSKYAPALLAHYQSHPHFVIGKGKMKELISFVSAGLQDFSISRVKAKMPWGVAVPDDPTQVMYVWFDALVSYLSTLNWPEPQQPWENFWPGVQICGKDNLRQQAAMWQAMLLSAGIPLSKQILVNGFITVDGEKMSKSVGNVIAPQDLINRYGKDASRCIIASLPTFSDDVDITAQRLDKTYTALLVNGLGNLSSRLAKLASDANCAGSDYAKSKTFSIELQAALNNYQTSDGWQTIVSKIAQLDQTLSQQKPWLITQLAAKKAVLLPLLAAFSQICTDLQIYAPNTAATLKSHFQSGKITPLKPLFPRLK